MATATVFGKRRLLLHDVDWHDYGRFLRMFQDRPAVRLTYDRGDLEITTISHKHESYGYFLGRLAEAATEELGLPLKGGRSTTFRRRKDARGLEPDNCYWITNEAAMRGKEVIDLRFDPPPDLAIEIDISRSSLPRIEIYATLRVPEVWRFSRATLTFNILGANSEYRQVSVSGLFPFIIPKNLVTFLNMRATKDENAVVRDFRAWVRAQIAKAPRL